MHKTLKTQEIEMKDFEKKHSEVLKLQQQGQNKVESSGKKQGGVLV